MSPDRYKTSSFNTYNNRKPGRYDDSVLVRLLQVSVMDDFVIDSLGEDITRLDILDVGCATARLLGRMAAKGARGLAGADLAPRILEEARARFKSKDVAVEFLSADAEVSLPWPSERFDVVTMTGVFHHFCRPHDALKQIRRVLRSGGRLIIADPCFVPPLRLIFNLGLKVHPHEGDCHFYSRSEASALISDAGWDVQRSTRLNWCFFGLVGIKAG